MPILSAEAAELRFLPETDGHSVAFWGYGNSAAPVLLLLPPGPERG